MHLLANFYYAHYHFPYPWCFFIVFWVHKINQKQKHLQTMNKSIHGAPCELVDRLPKCFIQLQNLSIFLMNNEHIVLHQTFYSASLYHLTNF